MPITASKGHGINQLLERALAVAKNRESTNKSVFKNTKVFDAVKEISELLKSNGYTSTFYYAIKLLEKDEKINETLKLSKSLESSINKIITEQVKQTEQDMETLIADLRTPGYSQKPGGTSLKDSKLSDHN